MSRLTHIVGSYNVSDLLGLVSIISLSVQTRHDLQVTVIASEHHAFDPANALAAHFP